MGLGICQLLGVKNLKIGIPSRCRGQDSAFTGVGLGSVPGQGTKILCAVQPRKE